jgi:hypothetical protein
MAPKSKARNPLLKPGMITLATVAYWSARHEPGQFDAASTGSWLLGGLATGLLARAALALFQPLLSLCLAVLAQAFQILQGRAEP